MLNKFKKKVIIVSNHSDNDVIIKLVIITGYWVSLSDSFQRVILFTTDSITADRANDTQLVNMIAELTLSITALGLSLVNDVKRTEVCYIGLTQLSYNSYNS